MTIHEQHGLCAYLLQQCPKSLLIDSIVDALMSIQPGTALAARWTWLHAFLPDATAPLLVQPTHTPDLPAGPVGPSSLRYKEPTWCIAFDSLAIYGSACDS